jgi:putative transposase
MASNTTKSASAQPAAETAIHLFDNWFDPIEAGLRDRVREFIQAMIEGELETVLSRPRYARRAKLASGETQGAAGATGCRHGHRSRSLLGGFGQVNIDVPRARLSSTFWPSARTPMRKTGPAAFTGCSVHQRHRLTSN